MMTYSSDLKKAILDFYKRRSTSYRKIAEIFGVSHMTVYYWVKPIDKISNRDKLFRSPELCNSIKQALHGNPFLTIQGLQQHLSSCFDHVFSRSFICTLIRKLGFRYKKAYYQKYTHNKDRLEDARRSFARTCTADMFRRCIVIDETYIRSSSLPFRGYQQKGKRLIVDYKLPVHKLSVIAGIGFNGERYLQFPKENVNGDSFSQFIEELPEGSLLLMDNVSFHKSQCVKQVMKRKNITAVFIPPYTPEYSPIEYAFSKVKALYRRWWDQSTSPIEKFTRAFSQEHLNTDEIQRMFNHVIKQLDHQK